MYPAAGGPKGSRSSKAHNRLKRLARKSAITLDRVREFVQLATRIWNCDAEESHELEFNYRTRIFHAIALRKLRGREMRAICSLLCKLGRMRKLKRWFA